MLTTSTHLLPDPTAFEQPLLNTTISLAFDQEGNTCSLRQEGLGGVDGKSGSDVLGDAWTAAEKRVAELREVLEGSS